MNSINYNTRRVDNINLHDAYGNISDQYNALRTRRNFIFIDYKEAMHASMLVYEKELELIYGKSIFNTSA